MMVGSAESWEEFSFKDVRMNLTDSRRPDDRPRIEPARRSTRTSLDWPRYSLVLWPPGWIKMGRDNRR
jgi:hypothetical protein